MFFWNLWGYEIWQHCLTIDSSSHVLCLIICKSMTALPLFDECLTASCFMSHYPKVNDSIQKSKLLKYSHGPSDPGFEPYAFRLQVQHSSSKAARTPQNGIGFVYWASTIRQLTLDLVFMSLQKDRDSIRVENMDLSILDSNLQPSSHKSNALPTELLGLYAEQPVDLFKE